MFYWSNPLFRYLLERVEKFPEVTFTETKLREISSEEFERLCKDKFLRYHQSDPDQETFPCPTPCDKLCDRVIGKIGKNYQAICPGYWYWVGQGRASPCIRWCPEIYQEFPQRQAWKAQKMGHSEKDWAEICQQEGSACPAGPVEGPCCIWWEGFCFVEWDLCSRRGYEDTACSRADWNPGHHASA